MPAAEYSTGSWERTTQTVLFVDIVESVRLYEQDEETTINRWRSTVRYIETELLPASSGRLVKSLGDGLLLVFDQVSPAVSTALSIQSFAGELNRDIAPQEQMQLRIGLDATDLLVDHLDVYGRGVMRAARLMTLAGPGEIVASAPVCDALAPMLDADIVDLGECFLKHIKTPVRAFRIGPPGDRLALDQMIPAGDLLPTLAVIPFTGRAVEKAHQVVGEVLADDIINALSRSPELNVISRLTTAAFRGRESTPTEIGEVLHANYVLSGSYRVRGKNIVLDVELAEATTARVAWSGQLSEPLIDVLSPDQPLVAELVIQVCGAIITHELKRARAHRLPTLQSYTLLMAAIALMHRLSKTDFDESKGLLNAVIDRATRQSLPLAWMAKWHVLRVQQGWSEEPEQDAQLAQECIRQALDVDPESSLALCIDGMVNTNLLKRLDVANERYGEAITANPSNPLAWLLHGTLHAFTGDGVQAVACTQRALRLTPLDPHAYFYYSLAATACLANRQYEDALALAERSLRANRIHTSTLRVKAAAEWRLGRTDKAHATAADLMTLEPNLTVENWLRRSPSAEYAIGQEWAEILREVGVPA